MHKLKIITFISGAVVMVLEIVGSRVLSPGLGSSTFVWTALIGVILAALSIGYWLGGKISDEKPSYEILSKILLTSSFLVLVLNIFKMPLLFLITGFTEERLASIIVSTILFAPPAVLLGMVSPYVVKLSLKDLTNSGETVGTLYALSTLGSIFGTFLAGFILLSFLGTTTIIYLLSLILLFLSVYSHANYKIKLKILMFVIIIVSLFTHLNTKNYSVESGYIDIDTNYSRVFIFNYKDKETERPARLMSLDKNGSSAMFLDGDDLVFEYTKYYNLGEHFVPNIENALMIGGAAYSYPKEFLKRYPNAEIDVVEIDPKVTDLAYEYFNLEESPRLNIFHQDGRVYLNNNDKKYDVIYMDAFVGGLTIPAHLTTIEMVENMYLSLADEGVVLTNLITAVSGRDSEFLKSEYHTYKQIFPQVYVFKVKNTDESDRQNLMLVALKSTNEYPFSNEDPVLDTYLDKVLKDPIDFNGIILTDEFAPVEHLNGKLL